MRIKDSSPCDFCDCVFLALAKQEEFISKCRQASMLLLPLFREGLRLRRDRLCC